MDKKRVLEILEGIEEMKIECSRHTCCKDCTFCNTRILSSKCRLQTGEDTCAEDYIIHKEGLKQRINKKGDCGK